MFDDPKPTDTVQLTVAISVSTFETLLRITRKEFGSNSQEFLNVMIDKLIQGAV